MKKNLVVVYGHVKNFDCGKIFGGALNFYIFFFAGLWLFWAHDSWL